jgi:uncharacterized YigZ family protein
MTHHMEDQSTFLSVDSEYRTDLRERGSRFVAYLFPVWEDGMFESRLSKLRKEYYDATHHCSAMIRYASPPVEQAHDDGEPSGTAGLPILNAMKSARLVNAGLIVLRYFGGTKLGKAGLIEAYGDAARECIQSAKLRRVEAAATVTVRSSYDNIKTVDLVLSKIDTLRLSSEYLESIAITLRVKAEDIPRFREAFDQIEYTGIRYELGEPGLVFAHSD